MQQRQQKKYGLQVRVKPKQANKTVRPPLPKPPLFRQNEDEDDDNVEKEISRHASKNKSLKDVEEMHKKTLEEDPSAFDYDGVYDHMKQEIAQPRQLDRQERKARYIGPLVRQKEIRQREQEIIYERKLAKERSKDDHLYADKEKFITSAFKKKLAEQEKWTKEEDLRQLQEEKEDVTKKSDLSDFYFNLGKNVAFGAKEIKSRKQEKQTELRRPGKLDDEASASTSDGVHLKTERRMPDSNPGVEPLRMLEEHQDGNYQGSLPPRRNSESLDVKPVSDKRVDTSAKDQPLANQPKHDHHKRNEDAVAAAKERFLARKKAKQQL